MQKENLIKKLADKRNHQDSSETDLVPLDVTDVTMSTLTIHAKEGCSKSLTFPSLICESSGFPDKKFIIPFSSETADRIVRAVADHAKKIAEEIHNGLR